MVTDAFALVRALPDTGAVRLEPEISPLALTVEADRIQILQVLLNLLRNACEATRDMADAAVRVIGKADGERVIVCVRDNGPGFAQEEKERFSAFATGKEEGIGRGLTRSRAFGQPNGGEM